MAFINLSRQASASALAVVQVRRVTPANDGDGKGPSPLVKEGLRLGYLNGNPIGSSRDAVWSGNLAIGSKERRRRWEATVYDGISQREMKGRLIL